MRTYALKIDWPLFGLMCLMLAAGLVVLYSAGGASIAVIERQAIRFAIGMFICLSFAQIHPRYYQAWAPWLYAIGLLLLVLVLFFGTTSKGAQRWLSLGGFRFQPSEMMKLAVPLMIAATLHHSKLPPSPKMLGWCTLMIMLPGLLIMKQPDLGTGLLIIASGFFVLFLAGLPWRYIIGLIVAGLCALPGLWYVLHDYQRQRVLTLLNPESDPLGSGYHIIQSKIAVGSGGFWGKGWLAGTQSQLNYLPERTTDFIFAVLSEEFGFIGVLILFTLYALCILRGLWMASAAQGTFSRLVGGSIILTFFIYLFVNVGMVTGILPVVGLPLPLISYGGTALITLLASFGILMSIHTHRPLVEH